MRSGPLTPTASTRTSTSPAAGLGTARRAGFRTSGPPGAEISMTDISVGIAAIAAPCLFGSRCSSVREQTPATRSQSLRAGRIIRWRFVGLFKRLAGLLQQLAAHPDRRGKVNRERDRIRGATVEHLAVAGHIDGERTV